MEVTAGSLGQPEENATAPVLLGRRRQPLADEVRDLIYDDFIRSGAVAVGGLLPSEAELSRRYGVSRVTLRAATSSLQQAGYVAIRHGVGTVILPRAQGLPSGIDVLESFEAEAARLALEVGTEQLTMTETTAGEEVGAKLGLAGDDPGMLVERIKTLKQTRVALMVDFVPARTLAPGLVRGEFRGSILDVLLKHPELDVEYADADVLPVALDDTLAGQLGVRPGSPALFMDEVTRARGGRALAWGKSWMLPGYLRFTLQRRKPFGR